MIGRDLPKKSVRLKKGASRGESVPRDGSGQGTKSLFVTKDSRVTHKPPIPTLPFSLLFSFRRRNSLTLLLERGEYRGKDVQYPNLVRDPDLRFYEHTLQNGNRRRRS